MKNRPPKKTPHSGRRWRRTILVDTVAALLVIAALPAIAATNLFTGSGSWNTPGNWSLGHIPAASDALFFNDPGLGGNPLNGSFTAQTLSFDTGADSFGIDANTAGTIPQTLTLTGGTNANGGTDLISLSPTTTGTITLGGNAGLGLLTVAFGNVKGTINVANSGAKLVFGANARITGTNGITKNGAGTLQILSNNTYTGGTTVTFGTIAFSSGSLGSGIITLNGGGLQWNPGNTQDISAQLAPIGQGGGTLDTNGNNVALASPLLGTGTVNKVGAGTLILNNSASTAGITLTAGTLMIGASGALGSGTLTINGGTLSFGGQTTATAGALSGSGALLLQNSSSQPVNFTVGSNNASTTYSGTLSGTLSGAGGGMLTQNGTGTLTLSGDLSGFNGGITLNQGTVTLAGANVSLPGFVLLNGGNLGFGNTTTTATLGGLNGGNASSTFSTQNGLGAPVAVTVGGNNGSSVFPGILTGNGALTKVGTGPLILSGNNSGLTGGITLNSGTLTAASSNALGVGTFTINGGSLTFQGPTSFTASALAGSGGFSLINTASQPVTFTVGSDGASTTYSGNLLGPGTLVMNGPGTLALAGTASTASIQLQAGTIDLSGNGNALGAGAFTLNGGGVTFGTQTTASAGSLAGSGTLVLTNASGQGVTFTVGSNGFSTTFGGAVTGLGPLVMNGAGTLSLNSANSTAAIALTNGIINLGNNPGGLGTGTFTINGGSLMFGNQTTASAGALAGSGSLPLQNNSSQPVTFTVGGNGASTTFSGSLLGPGTLVKNGTGTLSLAGSNSSFAGTITINQGTLSLTGPVPALGGVVNLNGGSVTFGTNLTSAAIGALAGSSSTAFLLTQNGLGAPLSLTLGANNFSTSFLGMFTGSGTVIKAGTGTLTISNPNSTAGITLSAGTLDISTNINGTTLGSGTFTMNGGTLRFGGLINVFAGALAGSANLPLLNNSSQAVTFTVGGNGASTTYSGSLTSFGTLAMNGPGTLGLSGTGSTANITLTAGTIDLSGNGSGLGTGQFTLNGGALTFGTQTSASAGALAGSGNLVLTNTSSQGVTFTVGSNNSTTTYSGAVTGSGTLVKTGTGTLSLINPNSTAGITLSTGTLDNSNNGSGTALGSGTFTMNGGTLRFGSLTNALAGGLAGTANLPLINNSSQPVTFTVGGNGASTTYSGSLTGFGTLVMNGPGTLGLSGSGSTANITLNGGTIDLSGSTSGLGAGLFTLNGGALTFGTQTSASAGALAGAGGLVLTNASSQGVTLTVGGNNFSTTYSGAATGLGTLVKTGTGTLTLVNPNSTAGITLAGGSLNITGNGNALGSGTFTWTNGVWAVGSLTSISAGALAGSFDIFLGNNFSQPITFTVGSNGASTTYSGSFVGPGTLVKIGAGTMGLSGASSTANLTLAGGAFDLSANGSALGTGLFTINGGGLNFGALTSASAGALAGSGDLVLTNTDSQGVAFTVGSSNGTTTYSGAVMGSGTLVKTGTGTLNLSNPNSTASITLTLGTLGIGNNGAALGSGTFTINGGTLSFGPQTSASAGALAGSGALSLMNGFSQPVAFTMGGNGASTTYSGSLSGTGSLIKIGAGALTLATANTYGGGTTINGGSIVSTNVGTGSALGGGSVAVGPAGMLTGVGNVTGTATVNGTLAPGNPFGVLNFGNTLTLFGGSQFQVTLGSATPGTGYNQAFVQNKISLFGNLSISLANGFVPTVGQSFFILDTISPGQAVNGTFSNVSFVNAVTGQITVNGATFQVNYADNNSDGGGNDVSLVYLGTAGSGFFTWAGSGANANWTTTSNWIGNAAPQTNNFNTQLIFAGSGTGAFLTPNNDTAGFAAGSITFVAGTGNFVLSGQSINLSTGGVTATRAGLQTIGNNIVLQGNQTWNIGNGSTLLVSGNISGLSSPILTKSGSGTLILTGTNTYGETIISNGTLQLGNGVTTGSLAPTSPITDGGNLTFNFSGNVTQGTNFGSISGGGTVTQAGTGTVFLGSNSYTGGTLITAGFVNFFGNSFGTGLVTLNGGGLQWATSSAADISSLFAPIGPAGGTFDTNGNNISFGTSLTGTGRVTKTGGGTLTLFNDQPGFSGGFTLAGGGLSFFSSPNALGSGTFIVNGGTLGFGSLASAFAGALAGSGGIALTNTNNQPVNFSVGSNGASTTYTGTLSGFGHLTMNGTGTLTLGGDSTGSTSTVRLQQGTVALGTSKAAAGYTLDLEGGTLFFGTLTSASAGGLTGPGGLVLANGSRLHCRRQQCLHELFRSADRDGHAGENRHGHTHAQQFRFDRGHHARRRHSRYQQ